MGNTTGRREDAVMILLEKVAGEETCQKDISASSPDALVNGLGMLIIVSARMIGIPEQDLMSILAARLFGCAETDESGGAT